MNILPFVCVKTFIVLTSYNVLPSHYSPSKAFKTREIENVHVGFIKMNLKQGASVVRTDKRNGKDHNRKPNYNVGH